MTCCPVLKPERLRGNCGQQTRSDFVLLTLQNSDDVYARVICFANSA